MPLLLQLTDWLGEKQLAAQDDTYRDAKNIHSKYMRHQAFDLEVKSNKDQLDKLVKDGQKLVQERPELVKVVGDVLLSHLGDTEDLVGMVIGGDVI